MVEIVFYFFFNESRIVLTFPSSMMCYTELMRGYIVSLASVLFSIQYLGIDRFTKI